MTQLLAPVSRVPHPAQLAKVPLNAPPVTPKYLQAMESALILALPLSTLTLLSQVA